MMDDRAPDETINVTVDGYNVVAYSFGSGDEVLFCVNGGPGLPCDYVRDAHSWLADKGYRVVAFDQLGTGKSDRPDDASLWTIERYVEETEIVRTALGLGPVHYYGQSWALGSARNGRWPTPRASRRSRSPTAPATSRIW